MSQVLPLSKWAKEPLADREEFRSGDEDENFDAKDEESFKLPHSAASKENRAKT